MKKKIYTLLVGINNYPSPISKLNGCIKDIDQIEAYLKANQEDALELLRLQDEQATYQNIIKGFRNHLRKATDQDVVWFHFSGHGSEKSTAEEFLSIEPNGKDQTLVCYQSTEEDQLHLADKEIALLLYEVATQDANGQSKACPHIIVSLDCCHSGSGTRDFTEALQFKTRGIEIDEEIIPRNTNKGRDINTYLDGYYAKEWAEKKRLEIPAAKHVLFSACQSIQKAGDLPQGGIFTSGLINALSKVQGNINYADLFVRTRAVTQRIRSEQTPQFETINNFDPYTRFLEGSAFGTPDRYEVVFENNNWFVKCGAIHGIPMNPKEPIQLEIQTGAPENKAWGEAEIISIGAQKSKLKTLDGITLDTAGIYQAVIRHLPANPVFVWLHGDEKRIEVLKKLWDSSKNIHWENERDASGKSQFEVEAIDNTYTVRDLLNGRVLIRTAQDYDSAIKIIDSFDKIVKWERTIKLNNQKSKIKNHLSFNLDVIDNKHQIHHFQSPEIKLYISKKNYFTDPKSGVIGALFLPTIIIKDCDQELFCYILHLRADYSINSYEGEVIYRPEEFHDTSTVKIPLWKTKWGWGLLADENESTSYFKFLITTESLDHEQLLQSGIDKLRDAIFAWNPVAVSDDWYSFTYRVTIVQEHAELQVGQAAKLSQGRLTIHPQNHLTGNLNLLSVQANQSSQDPSNKFALFSSTTFQLVDLSNRESKTAENVLEITNLPSDYSTKINDNPIEIELDINLEEDEILIPLSFDNEDFRIIGDAQKIGKKILVKIHELPQIPKTLLAKSDTLNNPFKKGDQQHRSLYEALKIAFFKLSLRQIDINHLEGDIKAIQQSNNPTIQLIIPGHITNPQDTANKLAQHLQQSTNKEQQLTILTYNYTLPMEENTGSSLWETVKENNAKLTIIAESKEGQTLKWQVI